MKIIFKRALSVILALYIIIAATACVMSMTALATEINTSSSTSSTSSLVKDESKKVMLKQENYKVREWKGELKKLNYQNFNFVFDNKSNNPNGKIKPETTYVLSFEYYSDPGPYEMGVESSAICVRTDKSGSWGGSNKDMLYNEEVGQNWPLFAKHTGRHKFEAEFTTYANQTSFYVALLSGVDGDAYFWDFKLVEKGTDTNLIKHQNFYGEWQDYIDSGYFVSNKVVTNTSFDGLGTYSFVPFNKEIAELEYGKVLGEEEEEEITSSEETSSTDVSSLVSSNPNTSSKVNSSTNTSSVETSSVNTSSNITTSAETSSDEVSSAELLNSSDDTSKNDQPKNTASEKKADFVKPLIIAIIIFICSIAVGAAAVVVYIKFFKNKN